MKKVILIVISLALLLMPIVACEPSSEPKPFPPPEGYSSWDEYYEEYYGEHPPITPSPESGLTSAEQTYIIYIEGHAEDMSYAFTELSLLLGDAQIFNDEWIIEAATYMVLIQFGYEEAQAADCPSSMSHIHGTYVQGLSHFNTAMDLIAEGIDYLDVDSLNRAMAEMDTGTILIEEAALLMTEFVLTHEQ